jgi:hypothetical protein
MDSLRDSHQDRPIARCGWNRKIAELLAAVAVLLVSGEAASAVQLIRYEISLNGKPILAASTAGHNEDSDAVWKMLKKLPLRRVKGYRIVPDRDEPLRSTLRGSIVIRVNEGGLAEVEELRLQRESENGQWSIAEIEVNRTLANRHKPYLFVVSVNSKQELSSGLLSRRGIDSPDDRQLLWKELVSAPLIPISHFKVTPDADDPLRATLQGKLAVELHYNRQTWGRVPISTLKLIRKTPKTRWTLDPDDAKRIAEIGASGS